MFPSHFSGLALTQLMRAYLDGSASTFPIERFHVRAFSTSPSLALTLRMPVILSRTRFHPLLSDSGIAPPRHRESLPFGMCRQRDLAHDGRVRMGNEAPQVRTF